MSHNFTYTAVDFDPFSDREVEKISISNESQRELWLSCILGGNDANLAYNESVSLEFEGLFNFSVFQKAIQELIKRHEALRSSLSADGESLIIYKDLSCDITFEDLSGLDDQRNILKSSLSKELNIPFDLVQGPLFRIFVYKLNETTHYFNLIIHHIVGDGWSIGIILQDLSKLYSSILRGESINLPRAPQISEYAAEQLTYKESEEHKATENFWFNQFKDNVPVLDMPLDFPRPQVRTYRGGRNDSLLEKNLYDKIKNLAAKAGCSLVTALLGAFEIFVYQKTGQQEIVIGLPAAGQSATGNYGLVGHCVNLLPLKSSINPEVVFIEYLKKRKSELYDAYDNQQFTFSELLKKINIKRDRSRVPLVPVIFNVDMELDAGVFFEGLTYKLYYNAREFQTFEMSLNIAGSKHSLELQWSYNTQLFSASSIAKMIGEFKEILTKVSDNPELRVCDIPINSTTLLKIDRLSVPYPKDKTIVDLFSEQAKLNPSNPAVIFENKKLTYHELESKSNQLANYLRSNGVQEDDFVPVCINPSPEMIIGILGILKAGGAYVPVDPEFPADRIGYMIEDTAAKVIVSNNVNLEILKNISNKKIISLDGDWAKIDKMPSSSAPVTKLLPHHLIYLIYTSGSTGRPKGVMIEHGSIVDYVYGFKAHVPVEQCRSYALGSTIATDLGNTVLFSSLALGGALHLFSKDRFNDLDYIHQYFQKNQIDCLKIVPSHWRSLSPAGNGLYPRKLLVFGGETLHKEIVKEIQSTAGSNCVVVNHYGPTETTIGKLLHIVKPADEYNNTIPIGKPFSNTGVYILNGNLNNCSAGIPGEIYIGGDGVARGYLNRDELTKEKFVPDIFSEKEGARMYRTGDLGRFLADGSIEYLGRIDDQVKIRGHRIELGEIENVLQQCNGVKQCVVSVHEDKQGEKKLLAYIVPQGKFDKESISSFLKSKLPEYMIPRVLIEMSKIPLTPNGKVDRKLLPEYHSAVETEKKIYKAPQTDFQKLVVDIWSKILGIEKISIDDDFFELGGHSLLALRAMLAIEKRIGKRLPLAMLFENSTVEKLARIIEAGEKEISWDCFVPIKTAGNKIPIYFIHGAGLNVLTFRSISKYLDADQPVYGLQAKGLNGKDEPLNKMEEIASHYIAEILKHNPYGPYALAGYSFGGLIAYEMAKQLKEMGKKVVMLGIFDTFAEQSNKDDSKIKKIVTKTSDFFRKVWCTFVLMADEPLFILKFRSRSMMKRTRLLIEKLNPVKKPKDPNDFYVYAEKIINNLYRAAQDYKLTPYDGTIDLFRAKRKTYYLPDFENYGWKPFALRGVNIHEVPGDHAEIFNPPNVEELAKVLQTCLDKANNLADVDNKINLLRAV